jgi:hypothetical protein
MDLFSKTKTREFNEKLEQILEHKPFSMTVKNLLLNILYNIETAYTDYSEVKVDSDYKENIIEKILFIVDRECNQIITVNPKSDQARALEKTKARYAVDENKGVILVYANELDLLSALIELDEKLKFVKYKEERKEVSFRAIEEDYLCSAIKKMMEKGTSMDYEEIIRDFNGWSWGKSTKDIEDILYNLMYQDLLMLLGCEKTKKIFKDYQVDEYENVVIAADDISEGEKKLKSYKANSISIGIINITTVDEIEKEKRKLAELKKSIKEEENRRKRIEKDVALQLEEIEKIKTNIQFAIEKSLNERYSKEDSEKFIIKLYTLLIAKSIMEDEKQAKKVARRSKEVNNEFRMIQNNKEFVETITKTKKEVSQRIKYLNTVLSEKDNLREEYRKRNPNYSGRIPETDLEKFKALIFKEKEINRYRLNRYNQLLIPAEYIKEKELITKERTILEQAMMYANKKDIVSPIVNLQKATIDLLKKQIEKAKGRDAIVDLIYKVRYFNMLSVDRKVDCYQVREILDYEMETINVLIDKAIYKKVIENISDSTSLCYYILKPLFESHVVELNEVDLKVNKLSTRKVGTNRTLYNIAVSIFDAQEKESGYEVTVDNLKMLNIRLDKKIKLFI